MRDEIHVPVFNISNKCQFFDVDVLAHIYLDFLADVENWLYSKFGRLHAVFYSL